MEINGYQIIGNLRTDNSGTAKWGFAYKGGEMVFIKEFLTPVYPEDKKIFSKQAISEGQKICRQFEYDKRRLYNSLSSCEGGGVVAANDFFRHNGRYYIVTEKVDMVGITLNDIAGMDLKSRLMICRVIAYNMSSIHMRGIVHADIKPDNILIKKTVTGMYTAKIIDFDNSFFEDTPPEPDDLQGDTVYLAPEAYLYMLEEEKALSTQLDVFALGILFCRYLTGSMPIFDHEEYAYLYAAVLDDSKVTVKDNIPDNISSLLLEMLSKNPKDRPIIHQVFERLEPPDNSAESTTEPPVIPTEKEMPESPEEPPTVKKKGFKQAKTSI